MPSAFNFQASPFDCLTTDQQQLVQSSVDIAYFPQGAAILAPGAQPTHLFVIIKGFVQQFDGHEVAATYGPDDCFDGRGLMAGKVSSRFMAAEEVVAYQLARQAVSDLIAANATFGALLFSNLSNKLSALSERQSRHELQSLTMARVDEAFVRAAHFVDADLSVLEVTRQFHALRTATLLVRDSRTSPPAIGIFTVTGLQRAILDGTPLDRLAVRGLTNFSLIKVRPGDQLGDALAVMIRHKVHRVVVAEGEAIVGVLEALDLFSFLSNHSYLINLQILDARDLPALQLASRQISRLMALLHRSGTHIHMIARLVQELNAKLFERAWQLVAPPDLVANSCLFVMGSEGRGEQLLKTDQDNGLVLRDGYQPTADVAAVCREFSAALAGFGYPPCPGHVMVSNPQWCQSVSSFSQAARLWLLAATPDGLMALAIFLDAHAVCGDRALLEQVRAAIDETAADNDAMLARFAAAANAFGQGGVWWMRLPFLGDHDKQALDIKKAGIFPLVHGLRSLALAHGIGATSTVGRAEALVAAGALPEKLANDLIDSLHFFMGLKLKIGLQQLDTGHAATDEIQLEQLSSLDRDLLKDTLGIVRQFKALLGQRFHLDAL
ncbi:MAG: cyclic nucleotide-binding protein [Polaromonas sp.]|jgi:CBS domain-containing protein|nr:cyclic nucleotide-binding protein [Polaromonas sp.]